MSLRVLSEPARRPSSRGTKTREPAQRARALTEVPDSLSVRRDSLAYSIAKRTLDLALSIAALIVAAPIVLLVATAIKLESRGPILFGQVRLGKHGILFRCYKFRTMRAGAQSELLADPELRRIYLENDFKIPVEKDPRVTPLGRFLRRSSLDELPQFFNVLAGSMSLVGPRPIVPEELGWYRGNEELFLSVRPGITGVWQVQGRSRIGYPDRAQIELQAIEGSSLWRDLKVLVKSIPAVITARGSL